VFPFCDITNISDLLPSEFKLLRNHVLSEEYTNGYLDIKFVERSQEDLDSSK
jgi:hypothetical protein